MGQKKSFLFIGFIILKTTGLSSRFQRKNRFLEICIGSRDIGQNMTKFEGWVWQVKRIFTNISGPYTYFSKPIFGA